MGTATGKKGVRKLRKSTPGERRDAVEAWQKSGLSQAMFAKQWGVNPITFSGWVSMAGAKAPGERRGRKPRLAEPVKREVVSVKQRYPSFGFLKIRDFVRRFSGMGVSTGSVRKVLKAEGVRPVAVVHRRRRKKSVGPPQETTSRFDLPPQTPLERCSAVQCMYSRHCHH
jgi:transposase